MSCSKSEIFSTFVDSLAVIGAFSIIAFALGLILLGYAYYLPKKGIDR